MKKPMCIALALLTVIMLTVLPSCMIQGATGGSTVWSNDPERPASLINSEEKTQNSTETQTEQLPDTSTSTSVETTKPTVTTASSFTKQSFKATEESSLSYWLYTPENATDNMPLLIYLHGGNGKGDDLEILTQYGFPKLLTDGELGKIPAYIVIPQVSTGMRGWTDIKNSVRDLVYFCCETYGTDENRVSLTGHSMGGTGTWNLALAFPSLFSCIAPMSGSITTNETN